MRRQSTLRNVSKSKTKGNTWQTASFTCQPTYFVNTTVLSYCTFVTFVTLPVLLQQKTLLSAPTNCRSNNKTEYCRPQLLRRNVVPSLWQPWFGCRNDDREEYRGRTPGALARGHNHFRIHLLTLAHSTLARPPPFSVRSALLLHSRYATSYAIINSAAYERSSFLFQATIQYRRTKHQLLRSLPKLVSGCYLPTNSVQRLSQGARLVEAKKTSAVDVHGCLARSRSQNSL